MHRRTFLSGATATIGAASIAGCSSILGDGDGGGGSGPESSIHAYAEAINDNDPEAFEDAFHPDAPDVGETPSASEMEQVSMSVESTEVIEEPEDGVAIVEAELEMSVEIDGESQTQTQTLTFETRTHDGEWKLYGEA